MTDYSALRADAAVLHPDLVALRRDLHRHPELGLHLPRTQQRVLTELAGLDLELTPGVGLSSVTGVLRGAHPGPVVLLRADMDALPVTEASGLPYAATVPGVMHACGHDLHTAALVGAARLLHARRVELSGSVVLMFQPGEEGDAGARLMVQGGVLAAAGQRVAAAYALHVMSSGLPAGVVTTRPGAILAAADTVHVTVRGRGGHGSMPHLAADPVPVACEIVLALQSMLTRTVDPFDPVVLTVTQINAGTAENVIAPTAQLTATVRTVSETAHTEVRQRVLRVCEGVAAAHGVQVDVDYAAGYPVTVNSAAEAVRAGEVAAELFGAQRYYPAPQPIMGSEDFSFVLEQVPGAFLGLGASPAGGDPNAYNHSPLARFDDGVLGDAAALLAALALDRLGWPTPVAKS